VLDRTSQQQFRRWWSSLPSQWRQTNACRAFFGKHKIPAKGSAVSYLLLDDFKTWFKALYHPHTLSPEEREFFKQEYFLGQSDTLQTLDTFKNKRNSTKRKRQEEIDKEGKKTKIKRTTNHNGSSKEVNISNKTPKRKK